MPLASSPFVMWFSGTESYWIPWKQEKEQVGIFSHKPRSVLQDERCILQGAKGFHLFCYTAALVPGHGSHCHQLLKTGSVMAVNAG
jgi:hypothetical protein